MDHSTSSITHAHEVDPMSKRKIDSHAKWFASHISELPGPKSEVIKDLRQEYRQEQQTKQKIEEEKTVLRSRILLGSYTQDQKYVEKTKPSQMYRTYEKGERSEWHRKNNNDNVKRQREMQLYRSNVMPTE